MSHLHTSVTLDDTGVFNVAQVDMLLIHHSEDSSCVVNIDNLYWSEDDGD